MKNQYFKPELNVELLSKSDVLLTSEQTDNNYVQSQSIFNDSFSVESILQG